MLCCTFRPFPPTRASARPLRRELGSVYSLPSLLFPCQSSLQYFQPLPALLVFYDVHVGSLSCTTTNPFETEMPRSVALISPRHKPWCRTPFYIPSFVWADGKICFKWVLKSRWKEGYDFSGCSVLSFSHIHLLGGSYSWPWPLAITEEVAGAVRLFILHFHGQRPEHFP